MQYVSEARTRRRGNFKHQILSKDRCNQHKFQMVIDDAIPDFYPYSTRYLTNEGIDSETGKRFRNYELRNRGEENKAGEKSDKKKQFKLFGRKVK